jgi:flavorubredoxin
MGIHHAPEICPGIFYVGVKDWNLPLFDVLTPLTRGSSYNSYLVKGAKTALLDSTHPGFEAEWEGRVSRVVPLADVDFLVMNHAEPDHAGAIPYFLERNARAPVVLSEKGAKMARTYFGVPEARLKVVKDGDSIDLGGKTLRFMDAAWLHWPEVIFTYVPEDGFLSSCDFFAAHTADGLFEDEVEGLPALFKAYWAEILMPYRAFGKKAVERIRSMDVRMIGPSHGPVRRDVGRVLDSYAAWTNGVTRAKATVVYVSMWTHTEGMVRSFMDALRREGVEAVAHNMARPDEGELAADLADSRALVLASPSVLGGLHPRAMYGAILAKALKPPVKYAAVLSSYGWAKSVAKPAAELLPAGVEVVGSLEVNGPATAGTLAELDDLAVRLASRIKAG